MNFKEIYKSANDEIHGDRSLIDEVLKKAEKKPVFKTVYPVACAAAALLIVVSVSMFPEKQVTEPQNITIASNKDVNKKEIKIEEDTDVELTVPEKHVEKAEETVNVDTQQSFPVSENEKAPEVEVSEKNVIDTQTDKNTAMDNIMLVMLDVNEIHPTASVATAYARSGGGGGAEENVEFEGMTAQQYYEYIGSDITQKIDIPDNMTFEEFFGTTVKRNSDTQEVLSDTAEFYASGEDKYLSVSVTKLSGDAQNKLNDETLKKSDVFGTPAVIEGYESTYRLYVKYGDVYYNMYSEGLTLEEIENLLISICKN